MENGVLTRNNVDKLTFRGETEKHLLTNGEIDEGNKLDRRVGGARSIESFD